MRANLYRAISATLTVTVMIAIADITNMKEIIYPVMAALTIGYWVVDKHVWCVSRRQLLILLVFGALCGTLIARYSPFSNMINIPIALCLAAIALFIARSTFFPTIATCLLPVMLHIQSWNYTATVFVLAFILISGQKVMEKYGWREKVIHLPHDESRKEELYKWIVIIFCVTLMGIFSIQLSIPYLILPPMVVCFTEMICSHASLKNRPFQILMLMILASCLGTVFRIIHLYIPIPQWICGGCIMIGMLLIFHLCGKYFAPAAALAILTLILPEEGIAWLPLQVALGSFMLIGIALFINHILERFKIITPTEN